MKPASIRNRALILFALLVAEILFYEWAARPQIRGFNVWAFHDEGTFLVENYFAARGLMPNVGFGFNHGLLELAYQRFWNWILGPTIFAAEIAAVAGELVIAGALAAIGARLEIGALAAAVLLAAFPFAIPVGLPAPELALLCLALAQQLRGRMPSALALATAACFAKPSLGYVYGLLLLLMIAWSARMQGWPPRRLWRALAPAAVTAIALAVSLAALYSPLSLARTILPLHGVSHYRTVHYGFFAAGERFWYFPGVHWGWYAGTVAGFWIAASLYLFAYAALVLVHRDFSSRGRLIVTCAAIHLIYIGFMWGGAYSWLNYFDLLLIGISACLSQAAGIGTASAGMVLLLLALLGHKADVQALRHQWLTASPAPAARGLWIEPDELAEWEQVLNLARGRRSAILTEVGGAALLFESFEPPVSAFLMAGEPTAGEVERAAHQVRDAQIVVVPVFLHGELRACYDTYPEIGRVLDRMKLKFSGRYFAVYSADGVPAAARGNSLRFRGDAARRRAAALAARTAPARSGFG